MADVNSFVAETPCARIDDHVTNAAQHFFVNYIFILK